MSKNVAGFLYPEINASLCVDCGLCVKSCAFQNIQETNSPIEVYAAVRKDREKLKKSVSGGLFAVFAEKIISEGGVVAGCSMNQVDGKLYPMHIIVEDTEELLKLQGSKYVQSDMADVFSHIKKRLLTGRMVLFSGTPCQAAGLKGYLKKEYDNLIIVDLICHGVPSISMFQDYIALLEENRNIKINQFRFRVKTGQSGLSGEILYTTKNGKIQAECITPKVSSYYSYFLNASMYRESCYVCPYTCEHRPGDITIGDFWGFTKLYNDFDTNNFKINDGISAVIVNTSKGKKFFESVKDTLSLYESCYQDAALKNSQLVQPSERGTDYKKVMDAYYTVGYKGVEKLFAPVLRKYKIRQIIKKCIPQALLKRLRS